MLGRLYADYLERRDKVQIYADIIKVTAKPTKTTRILRLANVQYNTFLECIETLCTAGLLEKASLNIKKSSSKGYRPKYTYQATDIGREWCESLDELYQTLEK
jgi:predicted transcriptional regulator